MGKVFCFMSLLLLPCMVFSQEHQFSYNYRTSNGYSGRKMNYEIFAKSDSVCVRTIECYFALENNERKDTCVASLRCDIPHELIDSVEKMLLDADVFNWNQSYYAKDVYDGDNWSLGVLIDGRQKWTDGYMEWPENAPMWEINSIIRNALLSDDKKN